MSPGTGQAPYAQNAAALARYAEGVNAMWQATFGQDLRQADLTARGFSAR